MRNLYHIKDKGKRTALFSPNLIQASIMAAIDEVRAAGRPVRLLVLKPRQIGGTTLFALRNLDRVLFSRNQFAAIIAHLKDKADEIFNEIVKFSYDHIPEPMRFKSYTDSVRQLGWRRTGSQIKVVTDGHGITPSLLHLTEVARMRNPHEVIGEALQGVPRGGEVIQESTANGKGGYFYDCCQDAMENPGGYWRFLFLRWWHNSEYSLPVPEDFIATEEERELLEKYDGLAPGNIIFRREKIAESLGSRNEGAALGISGEMLFMQNYPMTAHKAFVSSAISIFDLAALDWMRETAQAPIAVSQLGNGFLRTYAERRNGVEYLIACDPSYGESEDYSVAIVFERKSSAMVAKLRGRFLPRDLAAYLEKLGSFYNGAMVAVEKNCGHAVINELMHHLDYPRNLLYRHKEYDARGSVKTPGFYTTEKSRGLILSALQSAIASREIQIPDTEVIEELCNFGYSNGRAQAVHGHDDCVMAYAIGNYLCQQPRSVVSGPIPKPVGT